MCSEKYRCFKEDPDPACIRIRIGNSLQNGDSNNE